METTLHNSASTGALIRMKLSREVEQLDTAKFAMCFPSASDENSKYLKIMFQINSVLVGLQKNRKQRESSGMIQTPHR